MHYHFNDVNEAFREMVSGIQDGFVPVTRKSSRNGDVLRLTEPAILTFRNPRHRVLFNSKRDANPFFHVYESLWMLAGRNDLESLTRYVKTFSQFSDNGKTLNGAYGHRWRHHVYETSTEIDEDTREWRTYEPIDQLEVLIEHIRDKPDTRRAVLQMWNVKDDLLKIGDRKCPSCNGTGIKPGTESIYCIDCSGSKIEKRASKDVCCNTNVYFSVNFGQCGECEGRTYVELDTGDRVDCPTCDGDGTAPKELDMTVCNRSNDLIWGLLGANVVHFSFLQEYMAQALGLDVGVYNQMSNDLHVYTWNWEPEEWMAEYAQPDSHQGYASEVTLAPLFQTGDRKEFDNTVKVFTAGTNCERPIFGVGTCSPFIDHVARPMMKAHRYFRNNEYERALQEMTDVVQWDWRLAGTEWIKRRWERRKHVSSGIE